jgi:hypothetical protein
MELTIIEPKKTLPSVKFNDAEIKDYITNAVKRYTELNVDENNVASAKNELADLRKLRDVFEEKRKEVKRRYLEPYEAFEKRYKEIIQIIADPINLIDVQIKNLEIKEKEQKRKQIESYYNEHFNDISDVLNFEKIFSSQWLNSTYSSTKIVAEIKSKASNFRKDYKAIEYLDSSYKKQILSHYLNHLDLASALDEGERLKAQDEKIAKMKANNAAKEAEKTEQEKKIAAVNKLYVPLPKPETPMQAPETPQTPIAPISQAPTTQLPQQDLIIKFTMEVEASKSKLDLLKEFLVKNDISFRRIK